MRKIIVPALAFVLILLSCNNEGSGGKSAEQNLADSLEKQINDGHNDGMANMGRLTRLQQKVQHMVDSIETLPAKTKQESLALKARLDTLLVELNMAEMFMDKWMMEYEYDSAKNDLQKRIAYLKEESDKVGMVKESILGGIAKADSLLRSVF